MSVRIIRLNDAEAWFIAYGCKTARAPFVAFQVEWISSFERLQAFEAAGVEKLALDAANIKTCTLIGPMPQESTHPWNAGHFANHVQ